MENTTIKSTAITTTRFVIESAEAASMAEQAGLSTVLDLLPALVPSARSLARPPISNFPVGAVGLGSSGRIYLGVNLEFPGVPLNQSVHAEQFLITNACINGERRIGHIAVSHVPCGHCRQFLQELRGAAEIQILVTSDGPGAAFRPLADLLPHPFGPRDLLSEDAPLLLDPRDPVHHGLVLEGESDLPVAICNGGGGVVFEEKLVMEALKGARRAHAPYSGCPSGFAVGDEEGRVYGGGYAESAAYNPSLSPVQAALVAYVAAKGGGREDYSEIVAAALVEKGDAAVSHEGTARILMAKVAPLCRLRVYPLRDGPSV